MKIDPTTAMLISKTDGIDPTETPADKQRDKQKVKSPDWGKLSGDLYNESFYPKLDEINYGVEYGEGEYGGPGGEIRMRTLALRTPLRFGSKFPDKTVQELIDIHKTGYLRWIYYNVQHMNFLPEVLNVIGISEEYVIEKPGTNPELGEKLFAEIGKERGKSRKINRNFLNLPKEIYNPDNIKHKPLDFNKE